MDINQRIHEVYKKIIDLGYYNGHGDVENIETERFFNLINEIGTTKMLLILRNDISSELSVSDYVNEMAYEYLSEEFSVEEFPEIWI